MTNKNKPTTKVTTPEKVTKAKKPESKAAKPASKSAGKKPVTKIFDNKVAVKKPKATATTKSLLESMQNELTKTFG